MTKYLSDINLKSTVYNQNGQSYFEQLRTHNSMSSHLRRILFAKCAVDTRNKNYMSKRKQLLKQSDYKLRSVTEITNDVIDRLAYDTQHHPAEFLKISCDSRYFYHNKGEKYFTDYYDYDVTCSQSKLKDHADEPDFFTFQTKKSEPYVSNGQQTKQQRMKKEFRIENTQKHRYEDLIIYESGPDYLAQEINLMAENSSKDYNLHDDYKNYDTSQLFANTTANRKVSIEDDEAKYAKFVYEITNEIMENGFYTNEEFEEVFKKHLEKNAELLDMNRMRYEIYQLKVALSVDDLGGDKLENVRTRQLLNNSVDRPPPSPKTLNKKDGLEKILLYRNPENTDEPCPEKSILLRDGNTEIVVTERDMLTSLIEANVASDQAQKVYKNLFTKSKDILTCLDIETTERSSNEFTQMKRSSREQERGSTTSDFISYEEKSVQTCKKNS